MFIILPLIRIFFKRLSLMIRLSRACRKSGAGLYPCRRLYWLFHSGDLCDFVAVSGDRAFAVRLMAAKRKTDAITFRGGGYTVTRRFALVSAWGFTAVMQGDSKPKPLPGCGVPRSMRDIVGRRMLSRCLVINPVCSELFREDKSGNRMPVGSGDKFGDTDILTVYSSDGFIREIISAAGSP